MCEYRKLVEEISSENKVSMEDLLDIDVSVWERIKELDYDFYKNALCEVEDLYYEIPLEEARRIVGSMKPFGESWGFDEIASYIRSKGIEDKPVQYYLVMNMMRNDYYNTAKSVDQQDNAEFYYSLANDFIEDVDSKPHKVEKYFK